MAPNPQQRTTQQQRAAQAQRQQRAAQAQQRPVQQPQQRAVQPATQKSVQSRTGTADFERLMQRNTVDVRAAGAARRKRNPVLGKIALGLAVVSAAVDASAFAVFMGGDTDFAFGICFVVVFLTLIAAVLGFIAAVGAFGRWYGAVGVVVAFFANPVILIVILVVVAPEVLTDMGGTSS